MQEINHEYYVSLEVAKLLKEAGFNWKCNGVFISEDGTQYAFIKMDAACDNNNSKYNLYNISAPNLEVAQRWLREVKHLEISIHYDPTIKIQPYMYNIYDMDEKFNDIDGIISPITHSYSDGYFYKYEEALESGIKKAIEIVLEKGE